MASSQRPAVSLYVDKAEVLNLCGTFVNVGVDSHQTQDGATTKSTQTPGYVRRGREGELIVATTFVDIQMIIDRKTLRKLERCNYSVDELTDLTVSSLARLDWDGDRILERAMTAFRLHVADDLMPQLLREVCAVLNNPQDTRKHQYLVQELFNKFRVKLFGLDVGSFVFILEHYSEDDAILTLQSSEESVRRQNQIEKALLFFLPLKLDSSKVRWNVSSYRLTEKDRQHNFGFGEISSDCWTRLRINLTDAGAMEEPEDICKVPKRVGAPSASKDVPSASKDVPSASKDVLSASKDVPSASKDVPSASKDVLSASKDVLSASKDVPSASKDVLSASKDVPSASKDVPLKDIRVVLLGRSGAGKSTTGNTLLGRRAFKVGHGLNETEICDFSEGSVGDTNLQVIDTPGLYIPVKDPLREVAKCMAIASPGPHVFLFMLRCDTRFDFEDLRVYQDTLKLFGAEMKAFMIVILIGMDRYGDTLEEQEQNLREELKANYAPDLGDIIRDVHGRCIGLNNKTSPSDLERQAHKILHAMQDLVKTNNGRYFQSDLTTDINKSVTSRVEKIMAEENLSRKVANERLKQDIVEGKGTLEAISDEARSSSGSKERCSLM